jgi:hypothetical protein
VSSPSVPAQETSRRTATRRTWANVATWPLDEKLRLMAYERRLDSEEMNALAADPDPRVRVSLVEHYGPLPTDAYDLLTADLVDDVVVALIRGQGRDLPETHVRALAQHASYQVRAALAKSSCVIPDSVRWDLARDDNPKVVEALAWYGFQRDLPEDMFDFFCAHSIQVACTYLGGPHPIPVRIAYACWKDPRPEVAAAMNRASAIGKIAEPLDGWDSLFTEPVSDPSDARDLLVARTQNPAILDAAARSDSPSLRVLAATSTATSATTLEMLAGDESLAIRTEVARHPATPETALRALAVDAVAQIRYEVARRGDITVDVLAVLVKDSDDRVRDAAVRKFLDAATRLDS